MVHGGCLLFHASDQFVGLIVQGGNALIICIFVEVKALASHALQHVDQPVVHGVLRAIELLLDLLLLLDGGVGYGPSVQASGASKCCS